MTSRVPVILTTEGGKDPLRLLARLGWDLSLPTLPPTPLRMTGCRVIAFSSTQRVVRREPLEMQHCHS